MVNSEQKGTFFFTILFFGGLWGLVEATLGYLLHVLPEIMPVPVMSGIILFPAGLFFMVSAMRYTGRSIAVPATALVAAAVKLSSLALPFVAFIFVRNPALAILTEGAVAWIVLGIGEMKVDSMLPLKAMVMSFGWRALFLVANIAAGLSGIAGKPVEVQHRFVFLDGSIDATIITLAVLIAWALTRKSISEGRKRIFGPIPTLAALITGIGGQVIFASI